MFLCHFCECPLLKFRKIRRWYNRCEIGDDSAKPCPVWRTLLVPQNTYPKPQMMSHGGWLLERICLLAWFCSWWRIACLLIWTKQLWNVDEKICSRLRTPADLFFGKVVCFVRLGGHYRKKLEQHLMCTHAMLLAWDNLVTWGTNVLVCAILLDDSMVNGWFYCFSVFLSAFFVPDFYLSSIAGETWCSLMSYCLSVLETLLKISSRAKPTIMYSSMRCLIDGMISSSGKEWRAIRWTLEIRPESRVDIFPADFGDLKCQGLLG